MGEGLGGWDSKFRNGRLTRREFAALSALAAGQAMVPGLARAGAPNVPLPFPILDLNHVSIAVADYARSVAFYQRIFDLTVYTSQRNGEWPIMTVGDGPQFVCPIPYAPGTPPDRRLSHHTCVMMKNFDPAAAVKILAEMGVAAHANPRAAIAQIPVGTIDTPEMTFPDPDGIVLQIQDSTYCGGSGFLGDICNIPAKPVRNKAPLVVRKINSVQMHVSNVDASLAFYQRVFGYKVKTRQAKGAVPVMTVGSGPQYISLHEGSKVGHHFCLGIENFDVDRVMKTLKGLGVDAQLKMRPAADQRPVVAGARDTPEISIVDPDGVVVMIADWRNAGGAGPIGALLG